MSREIEKLLRHSVYTASVVLDKLSSEDPFDSSPTIIKNIRVGSLDELDSLLRDINSLIHRSALNLDPRKSIPILAEIISKTYYDSNFTHLKHYGLAAKGSIASVFRYGLGKSMSSSSTSEKILQLISLHYIEGLLRGARDIFLLHQSQGHLEIKNFVVSADSSTMFMLRQLHISFNDRGAGHRTLPHTKKAIWSQINSSLTSIFLIIDGKDPHTVSHFNGTLFSDIPQNSEFWLGLASRLLLLQTLKENRVRSSDDALYMTVFTSYPVVISGVSITTVSRVQEYTRDKLFWNAKWCKEKYSSFPYNMIVDRPAIRVTDLKDTYCTSQAIIVDSINAYVEASVMEYRNWDRSNVPEFIFQKYISHDFEKRIIDMFRQYGFLAGIVETNGAWKLKDEVIVLENQASRMPGEIDLLAFDPVNNIIVIADCKVINIPNPGSHMKSVIDKIGPDDSESFHSKVGRKAEWALSTTYFAERNIEKICTYIIIDKPLPAMYNIDPSKTSQTIIYESLLEEEIASLQR